MHCKLIKKEEACYLEHCDSARGNPSSSLFTFFGEPAQSHKDTHKDVFAQGERGPVLQGRIASRKSARCGFNIGISGTVEGVRSRPPFSIIE